nr:arabinosyltransferase domain-containing protein [Actinomycetota bacterium]
MTADTSPGRVHLLRSVAALAAVVCALALPFAPVLDEETTVRWSSAGAPATTALFVPYRAAELTAEVSCAAVRSALAGPGRTVLLATAPEAAPRAGLLLVADGGSLTMLLDERDHPVPLPAGPNCSVLVTSTRTGTAVTAGGEQVVRLDGDVVPEVFTFRSDTGAGGVTVTARTRNWFESTPTPLKTGLIVGYGLLLALAVATTVRSGRPTRAPTGGGERPTPRRSALLVDLAVLAVLAAWLVIGPLTDDDGFATMTMRNGALSGDIGNYYRWFNASEAPFTLLGHLTAPLTTISLAPPFLRLPSLLAGVLSWFVISRGVLGAALPAVAGAVGVRLLAAVAFLAWWLPFDLGMRPESFVALGAATVLALLLRMRRHDPGAPRALHLALAAALVAGLTVAVTPSGLLVAVPVLIALPAILRLARARGVAGGTATVLLLIAAGAVGVVAMFADQTLDAVVHASVVHTEFGPTHGWWDERLRYDFLLSTDAMGSAAKRLPVLLTLALLPITAVLLSRKLPGSADLRSSALLTAAAAGGFAVLGVLPSKWSHHFGALVGFAVPFLVAAVLVTLRAARRHCGDRAVLGTCVAATAVVAVATALAFSGPNAWWLYSDYGMPWSDEPVRPLGVPLNSPLTWVAAAAAVAVAAVALGRRGSRDLRAAGACTGGVLPIAAMAGSVALLLGSFAAAPVRLAGTYTPAAQSLGSIRASSCGLQDHVQVLPEIPGGVLRPAMGSTAARGFVPNGGFHPDR